MMVAIRAGPMSAEARALASDPRHIDHARRVAYSAARENRWLRDDLEGAALHALCLAARSFDAALGVPFDAFLHVRALGLVRNELRAWRRCWGGDLRAAVPRSAPARDRPVGWEAEWEDLLGLLPARRRAAVRLRIAEGLTLDQAGARLGLPEWTVRYEQRAALEALRAACRPD